LVWIFRNAILWNLREFGKSFPMRHHPCFDFHNCESVDEVRAHAALEARMNFPARRILCAILVGENQICRALARVIYHIASLPYLVFVPMPNRENFVRLSYLHEH